MVLLQVRDLKIEFNTFAGTVKALDGVSFDIAEGETLGLVGETGCGKSITAHSVMRLLPDAASITEGQIWFQQENLFDKTEDDMVDIRGNLISMIFQEPLTALNPVYPISYQMTEAILLHQAEEIYTQWMIGPPGPAKRFMKDLPVIGNFIDRDVRFEAEKRAIEALRLVKIPDPSKVMDQYPHELSGGMKQRVLIAMALACKPVLLIADEPTTALDVTIQAQILDLMRELNTTLGTSILLITHDLGVVAEMCDRVCVMYAGVIVENAKVDELFKRPLHPYAQGLLKAIPSVEGSAERLQTITGSVPNLIHAPTGCRFNPRCPFRFDLCISQKPRHVEHEPGHYISCHHYDHELLAQYGYKRG